MACVSMYRSTTFIEYSIIIIIIFLNEAENERERQ